MKTNNDHDLENILHSLLGKKLDVQMRGEPKVLPIVQCRGRTRDKNRHGDYFRSDRIVFILGAFVTVREIERSQSIDRVDGYAHSYELIPGGFAQRRSSVKLCQYHQYFAALRNQIQTYHRAQAPQPCDVCGVFGPNLLHVIGVSVRYYM